jgi:hypothetical protein
VAIAMVQGPAAGLDLVATVDVESHHVVSVRAHLLEMRGDCDAARAAYRQAARLTTSIPERRHLVSRATRLSFGDRPGAIEASSTVRRRVDLVMPAAELRDAPPAPSSTR